MPTLAERTVAPTPAPQSGLGPSSIRIPALGETATIGQGLTEP
jgi:hypothetical protein